MKQLRQAFEQDEVLLDLAADGIEEAVAQTVRMAVQRGRLSPDQAALVEADLLRREREFSTAIGNGVAVPHAFLEGIETATVFFVRLRRPINMGAPDGVLTRFLFVLIGSPGRAQEHLDAITQIARLMADDEFRYDVRIAVSRAELLTALDRFDARIAPIEGRGPQRLDGLNWTGHLAGGLIGDIRRRWSCYKSDFLDGLQVKAIGSTLFLFFACLAPTIAFGGLTSDVTGGQVGAIEMLVATGIGGILFALLSGQPLIILGGTGPVLVFTGILARLCESMQVPFLAVYGWVGLWSALFLLLLAVTDASVLIRYFTRFTDEIFAALISLIFIVEALKSLLRYAHDAHAERVSHDVAFLSLMLGIGTFILAMILARFRSTRYLSRGAREFLADFGPTIAVVLMLGFAASFPAVEPERLTIPQHFQTTTGRPWLVPLFEAPTWIRWAAVIPAFLLTLLIYFTQNITARLVNSADHKLQKGPGYHLDLAVISVLTAGCSMLGLPWLAAATVRSLNHVRSLATVEDIVTPAGDVREEILHVCQTRLTGLAINVLICLSLLMLPLLKMIPVAVLYGLFLFMGVVSFGGNQFFERMTLWVTDPELYPRKHYTRRVPLTVIHAFTAVQVVCLAVLWIINISPAGIIFPLLIALVVPVRMLLSKFFTEEHLAILDAEEFPEEEESTWV